MAGRKLVSTRRRVPKAEAARYADAWSRLAATVRDQSAHAWRFAAERDEGLFIEFIEFAAGGDPRQTVTVLRSLAELEEIGEGIVEVWIDAEDLPGRDKR